MYAIINKYTKKPRTHTISTITDYEAFADVYPIFRTKGKAEEYLNNYIHVNQRPQFQIRKVRLESDNE